MQTNKLCLNCRYWHLEGDRDGDREKKGECRLNPPVVLDAVKDQDKWRASATLVAWPLSLGQYWCGQHQDIEADQ